MLVLGAGAGRLAYDLHQCTDADLTVGLDFNPLLLGIARRASRGEEIDLWEFPIAPKSARDHAVLQRFDAEPARPGLEFVLGDALRDYAAQRGKSEGREGSGSRQVVVSPSAEYRSL